MQDHELAVLRYWRDLASLECPAAPTEFLNASPSHPNSERQHRLRASKQKNWHQARVVVGVLDQQELYAAIHSTCLSRQENGGSERDPVADALSLAAAREHNASKNSVPTFSSLTGSGMPAKLTYLAHIDLVFADLSTEPARLLSCHVPPTTRLLLRLQHDETATASMVASTRAANLPWLNTVEKNLLAMLAEREAGSRPALLTLARDLAELLLPALLAECQPGLREQLEAQLSPRVGVVDLGPVNAPLETPAEHADLHVHGAATDHSTDKATHQETTTQQAEHAARLQALLDRLLNPAPKSLTRVSIHTAGHAQPLNAPLQQSILKTAEAQSLLAFWPKSQPHSLLEMLALASTAANEQTIHAINCQAGEPIDALYRDHVAAHIVRRAMQLAAFEQPRQAMENPELLASLPLLIMSGPDRDHLAQLAWQTATRQSLRFDAEHARAAVVSGLAQVNINIRTNASSSAAHPKAMPRASTNMLAAELHQSTEIAALAEKCFKRAEKHSALLQSMSTPTGFWNMPVLPPIDQDDITDIRECIASLHRLYGDSSDQTALQLWQRAREQFLAAQLCVQAHFEQLTRVQRQRREADALSQGLVQARQALQQRQQKLASIQQQLDETEAAWTKQQQEREGKGLLDRWLSWSQVDDSQQNRDIARQRLASLNLTHGKDRTDSNDWAAPPQPGADLTQYRQRLYLALSQALSAVEDAEAEIDHHQQNLAKLQQALNAAENPDDWPIHLFSTPFESDTLALQMQALLAASMQLHHALIRSAGEDWFSQLEFDYAALAGHSNTVTRTVRPLSALSLVFPAISLPLPALQAVAPFFSAYDLCLVDAGECNAPAVLTALASSSRTSLIGCPFATPASAIPAKLNAALMHRHGISSHHDATQHSVLTLANRDAPVGWTQTDAASLSHWLSLPQLMNRPAGPITSLLATLAGYPVEQPTALALEHQEQNHREHSQQASWLHCLTPAEQNREHIGSQFNVTEAEQAMNWLLSHRKSRKSLRREDLSQCLILTPFESALEPLRTYLAEHASTWAGQLSAKAVRQFLDGHVLALHAQSLPAAKTVLLVLGGHQRTAIEHAASNSRALLFGVAAAREQFIVIGNHHVWSRTGYGRQLAAVATLTPNPAEKSPALDRYSQNELSRKRQAG